MRILRIFDQLISTLPYLNAGPKSKAELNTLPIIRVEVDALPNPGPGPGPGPEPIEALLIASDLQGVVIGPDRTIQLLGCALADHYASLVAQDPSLPALDRTGVILAGDLYSAPAADERGATGDVRVVWYSFADRFAFVAGVAGNHDLFGTSKERRSFSEEPGIHLFDGTVSEISGLKIGGVSGIIGEEITKNERKSEDHFLRLLSNVLEQSPDIVVLHQGPDGGAPRLRGSSAVRELIAAGPPVLTICGHAHWPEPLAEPDKDHPTLNVDGRAMLLVPITRPFSRR